jgi:hypothetical protein
MVVKTEDGLPRESPDDQLLRTLRALERIVSIARHLRGKASIGEDPRAAHTDPSTTESVLSTPAVAELRGRGASVGRACHEALAAVEESK